MNKQNIGTMLNLVCMAEMFEGCQLLRYDSDGDFKSLRAVNLGLITSAQVIGEEIELTLERNELVGVRIPKFGTVRHGIIINPSDVTVAHNKGRITILSWNRDSDERSETLTLVKPEEKQQHEIEDTQIITETVVMELSA